MSTLAITGVTGQLGRLVATDLAARGLSLRLIARAESASKVPALAGTTTANATYGDAAGAGAALEGIELLFMVSASESADRMVQHRTFIDAAASAGVKHVVYTSFLGAAADCTFTLGRDHWHTEALLRASGMAFTFLRDNLYLDFLPLLAGVDGVIRGPAGTGAVSAVARADVARAAAAVLASPAAHRRKTYDLTGREALSLGDVARIVSEMTKKKTTYHDETIEEAYASRQSYKAPTWQVDAWVSTYTAIAKGELAKVSGDIHALTGRPPLTLRDYFA